MFVAKTLIFAFLSTIYALAWKNTGSWYRRLEPISGCYHCVPYVICNLYFRRSTVLPESIEAAFTGIQFMIMFF